MTQNCGENMGMNSILNALSSPDANGSTNTPKCSGWLVGEAALTNKFLLHVGFINMMKGIARGW